jgi:hypothetical protein
MSVGKRLGKFLLTNQPLSSIGKKLLLQLQDTLALVGESKVQFLTGAPLKGVRLDGK